MEPVVTGRAHDRLRHIAEAMPFPGSPKPRQALPALRADPPPIPMSSFSAYYTPQGARQRYEPRCNHSTMTRLYNLSYRCEQCRQMGRFGWLYRCTMDRDPLIMGAKANGCPVSFDDLGERLAEQMSLGKYGPDARAEKYSFLKELTPDQMASYTPKQIATILAQRERVPKVIAGERRQSEHPVHGYARLKFPYDSTPWMPAGTHECQYKVCARCHPLGKDKSWLSLNGVLNGDIPPTAATGFSFAYMGSRPCADVEFIKNIGYRAVPLPRWHPSRLMSDRESASSSWSMMETVDERLEKATYSDFSNESSSEGLSASDEALLEPPRRLPRSQLSIPLQYLCHLEDESDEENVFSVSSILGSSVSSFPQGLLTRPPWTPPPTPDRDAGDESVETKALDGDVAIPEFNGRRPGSLETNPFRRETAFSSARSIGIAPEFREHRGHGHPIVQHHIPHILEEQFDAGLVLPPNPDVYACACNTPLPDPNAEEELFFSVIKTGMEEAEDEEGHFGAGPLDVPDGLALTEEAVELGTPDVVGPL